MSTAENSEMLDQVQSSVSPKLKSALQVVKDLPISLDRDLFLRTLIRELSGVLEDVVGLDEASGFVSVVGQKIGEAIDHEYRSALKVSGKLSREQVVSVMVDLKDRIQGDFKISHMDEKKVVFVNSTCPFEDKVEGRQSMCMMTSNVFGTVASESLGYAKVELLETIAAGDPRCKVVVYFDDSDDEAKASTGREYYPDANPS